MGEGLTTGVTNSGFSFLLGLLMSQWAMVGGWCGSRPGVGAACALPAPLAWPPWLAQLGLATRLGPSACSFARTPAGGLRLFCPHCRRDQERGSGG